MSPVAALGLTQIIGYGTLYYAFPLIAPSVAETFARPEAHLYAVFSVGLLAAGAAAPFAGRLVDRIGAPRLMTAGSLAAGATLLGLAAAPGFWSWAALNILADIVSVAVLYDAAFAALALLRRSGARRAITRLTLVAGFASTVFWPLTGWLVADVGWRATYLAFAVLHLTLGAGLHLWLARQVPEVEPVSVPLPGAVPEARPLPPDLVPAAFRAVAASFALSGALITGFGVHMVPVLAQAGLGPQATFAAMLVGPSQVAIRLVDAVAFARLHPLSVAILSALALPASVVLLLPGVSAWLAGPFFAVLFGVGQGLSSIVRGSVPLALFGPAGYGARLGLLALVRTPFAAAAPVVFATSLGLIGLVPSLSIFAALGVAGAVPLLCLRARLAAAGHLAPLI